jgi:hypothetical protein
VGFAGFAQAAIPEIAFAPIGLVKGGEAGASPPLHH